MVCGLLSGCIPSSESKASISISCDDFQSQHNIVRTATLNVGETLTVSLCSNKTTGFSWQEKADIDNAQILEQTDYKWNAPQNTGKVGVAGAEVYTFKALKAGASSVSLGYSQPWQGGQKNANTFKVNITVK